MPRGNDSIDAARELQERFRVTGNAEDLIAAQRAKRSRLLRTATLLPADEEETKKLHKSGLKAVGSKAGVEGEVLSATVRGDYVVYTERQADGRTRKGVYLRSGETPEEPLSPLAASAAAANAAVAAAEEALREAEEAQRKAESKAQEAADKAREAARKQAVAQSEAAKKAAAKDEKASKEEKPSAASG